jgi:phage shock protein PspC (stress-responsive transcriptional regulator)
MAKAKQNKQPAKPKVRKLYRASKKDSMIGGVCAGIAEYFNVDPTFIRLLWALLIFAFGGGFLAYLLFWIIVPRRA